VSGARELAAAAGARVHSSAVADSGFERVPIKDGDEFRFGELLVRVLETPGHTPEHVCYTVADTSRSDLPAVMLTGGDLLVGSVGRPDLLGKELGEQLAPKLFDSLHHNILSHDDFVAVLPTHGAGSSCGANISKTRISTIGYERRTNPFLQQKTKDDFIRFVLAGQPAVPAYYERMRPGNQQGPRVLGTLPQPRAMCPDQVEQALAKGSVVIDGRMPAAFGGAHIAGSYSIGLGPNFSTWVGSVAPAGQPIVLVLDGPSRARCSSPARPRMWCPATVALRSPAPPPRVWRLRLWPPSWSACPSRSEPSRSMAAASAWPNSRPSASSAACGCSSCRLARPS
jgi:hydroxyacylglutathione hydrolase